MVRRKNRVKVVLILAFFLTASVFSQDKQVNNDKDKKLREEILAAYQSGGEQGLLDFLRKKKDKIPSKFIVDFAQAGVKERKEKWLKACKILAEEKKDEKVLANVLYEMGEYFIFTSDYKKAINCFDKALSIYEKINDPVGQGDVYSSKGEILLRVGDNSQALEMYDKALTFFENAGDSLGQGDVYDKKGDIYFYTGNNLRAFEMYDKAMSLFEKAGSNVGQGNICVSKGIIYLYTGDNSRALQMYDRALIFFEKAGDTLGKGNVYFDKGHIYLRTGDNSRALKMYDNALTFYKKARITGAQGNVYLAKGDVYLYTSQYSSALEMYDKALSLFEKVGESLGLGNVYAAKGDIYRYIDDHSNAFKMYDKALFFYEKKGEPRGQAHVYQNKGNIYEYTGDHPRALEMYEEALLFFEKAGDPLGQGQIYNRKGNIYRYAGDNLSAFEMFEKALVFFEKAGEPRGQGNVCVGKGDIYLKIGNLTKAIQMFETALPFFEKAEDNKGLGNVYWSKGDIYSNTGNNSRALEMYEKALIFFEKAGDSSGQGNVYVSKGDIYNRIGSNSRAFEMYDKALVFFEKAGDPLGQGNVYLGKGDIYLKTNNNSSSLEMYQKAIAQYRRFGEIELESITLNRKAKVLVRLGKKDEALDLFEKSIANLEKVRMKTAFSEMKRSFMETVYEQYEETVIFMLENMFYEKGFKYAESMRSRVFLDRIAEGLVRLDKGLMPALKEKRDKLVAKLSLLSKEIHETAGKKDEKKLKQLKEQYLKVEDEFDEMLIKIRLNNPLYASVRYTQPISVQELQRDVLKKGEILVRYFISPAAIYVFLVSKDYFKVIPIKIKEKEISSSVDHFLLAIKENSSKGIKRFGKTLYKKLLQPVETVLKEKKDIIIIPDGCLAKIPFESLVIDKKNSGGPVFILETYRIKYIQSASILSVLRKHYHRDSRPNRFVGFGDPVYDYEKFTSITTLKRSPNLTVENEIKEIHRGKFDREGGKMIRLEGSGQEVETIAELFKKNKSKKIAAYLRENATEDKAKAADMKDFDFIHFACHGILAENFQSLVFSQDIPGSKDDGYFTLNEVMNCDYNAKLVVLSACQTGTGKMERAEGVTGLTRAVMYAGTPAVAASLWKVDDNATRELMVNFYRNMLEKNLDKTEALTQAKLELLKEKKYSSPLYWSPFVMYGE